MSTPWSSDPGSGSQVPSDGRAFPVSAVASGEVPAVPVDLDVSSITICSNGGTTINSGVVDEDIPSSNLAFAIDIEQHNIDEVFHKLDKDEDGFVTLNELTSGLKDMKIAVHPSEVKRFFVSIDKDRDGRINIMEFCDFCRRRQRELRLVFDAIDKNADGTLSSEEIKLCIRALGLNVSSKQLQMVMNRLAQTQMGEVVGVALEDSVEITYVLMLS